jgi:hypothetical protein
MPSVGLPANLWYPHHAFGEAFDERHAEGLERLRHSSIAVVGLARNCGSQLADNLQRVHGLASMCKSWQLHIESNDCDDDTLDVLAKFSREHRQATFHYQMLGRGHHPGEFGGRRTIALAEYRAACQRWVRACAADADYVLVLDFDSWGGFSLHGLCNGIGWLVELPGAYGMASTSLFQHNFGNGIDWYHYDLWALRGVGQADCYFDTYQNGYGGFGYTWLPPVGSPPVLVSSAFGGMTIYRTDAFLAGTYDGTADCEHVPFHKSIAKATGQHLFLNPSQRCVMHWMEVNDGHCIDGVPDASSDA